MTIPYQTIAWGCLRLGQAALAFGLRRPAILALRAALRLEILRRAAIGDRSGVADGRLLLAQQPPMRRPA